MRMEQVCLDSRGCSQALLRSPTSPEAAAVFCVFVTVMTFSPSETLTFRVECLCVRVSLCVLVWVGLCWMRVRKTQIRGVRHATHHGYLGLFTLLLLTIP